MSAQIALLRGINVGGRAMVGMGDLRAMMERLGFQEVRTFLQSGNVLFRGGKRSGAALESFLEGEAGKALGTKPDFMVRTPAEWEQIISGNPFPAEAKRDPARLVVVFLKSVPGDQAVEALRAAIRGREVIQAAGRHLYAVYPDGQGRSKLTLTLIEAKLGTRGTARNWNTILKLGQLAGS
jgi:uncharacterized protein (DUF1697 family)